MFQQVLLALAVVAAFRLAGLVVVQRVDVRVRQSELFVVPVLRVVVLVVRELLFFPLQRVLHDPDDLVHYVEIVLQAEFDDLVRGEPV